MAVRRNVLRATIGLSILIGSHFTIAQTIALIDTSLKQSLSAVPQTMNYQGYLTDSHGNPVTGTVAAQVSLWDAESNGRLLWQEQVSLDCQQGYFTIELGKISPLSRILFNNSGRWLQMNVDGETLTPRKQILPVPMAMQAENAAFFDNLSSSQFYLRSQADDHAKNKIDAASLGGISAGEFLSKPQMEAAFVSRNSINSINSEMIIDGAISRQDIGFQLGQGTISGIKPGVGISGGGLAGEVNIALATEYVTGQVYDNRFVRKGETNSVTYNMLAEESVGSGQIRNGSIMPIDLGFAIGNITQIIAGTGLAGGGAAGIVTLSVNSDYQSGAAFDSRFVNLEEDNSITSRMIRDGEISGADIKNYSVTQEDMAFEPGDITSVLTLNGLVGGKTAGEVVLQLAPNYIDGSAYDNRFPRRDQASVTSDMIVDGTIQIRDMGFPAGDITGVFAGPGLRTIGTGQSGDVTIQLDNTHLSGEAFDARFIKLTDIGKVSGALIIDGDIGAMDLGNNVILERHIMAPMSLSRFYSNGALFTLANTSTHPNSFVIEVRGYTGLKGFGTHAGVYGEGEIYGLSGYGKQTGVYGIGDVYGVYAKVTNEGNPSAYSLFVEGRARCSNGAWSDVAEYIHASETVEAGDVVILDATKSYSVRRCDKPYDSAVAGVVSTDPTIMVGGLVKNGTPLALTGIVPCKVSSENGPIQAGDLLTTSSTPGHAMKATDKRAGTIIGKALESFSSARGVIQVLVGLM